MLLVIPGVADLFYAFVVQQPTPVQTLLCIGYQGGDFPGPLLAQSRQGEGQCPSLLAHLSRNWAPGPQDRQTDTVDRLLDLLRTGIKQLDPKTDHMLKDFIMEEKGNIIKDSINWLWNRLCSLGEAPHLKEHTTAQVKGMAPSTPFGSRRNQPFLPPTCRLPLKIHRQFLLDTATLA